MCFRAEVTRSWVRYRFLNKCSLLFRPIHQQKSQNRPKVPIPISISRKRVSFDIIDKIFSPQLNVFDLSSTPLSGFQVDLVSFDLHRKHRCYWQTFNFSNFTKSPLNHKLWNPPTVHWSNKGEMLCLALLYLECSLNKASASNNIVRHTPVITKDEPLKDIWTANGSVI